MVLKIKTKKSQKKTSKEKVKARVEQGDIVTTAEEYKALKQELDQINETKGARLKELKKELVEYGNENLADDEDLQLTTSLGKVKIGKRGTSRSVTDMDKAIEFMGTEVFLEIAKVSLSDLDKYLTPPQLDKCVEKSVTDNRRITT